MLCYNYCYHVIIHSDILPGLQEYIIWPLLGNELGILFSYNSYHFKIMNLKVQLGLRSQGLVEVRNSCGKNCIASSILN